MIDQQTEQRILGAAKVEDVLRDQGVELTRRGRQLLGLCPFHEDRHIGSFVVNERGNYYVCFACGAKGDAMKALMELTGKRYPDALRYLAAMYGIYVDESPVPQVMRREPRRPLPKTTLAVWQMEMLKPYMHHYEDNPLLTWMLSLPMRDDHKANLRNMLELYFVGTSLREPTKGWTVFPQIDEEMRVRDIKLMAYKADGHRNKDLRYSFNWMHSMLAKRGTFNEEQYHVEHCLFGLHLAKLFPEAEVCLVESEKSAMLCSAFSDPHKRIWLATGGKSGLNPAQLAPLISTKRYIVLYPDLDGYADWEKRAEAIDYPRLSISQKPRELHRAEDGEKADIADIMVRIAGEVTEKPEEVAARRLGAQHLKETLKYMIDTLQLTIDE